ncbi:uncharacterized protein EI97DRAFT_369085, partial [Westerdykella ornata]
YDDRATRKYLNNDSEFQWCMNCSSEQKHEGGSGQKIFTCAECRFRMCVVHGRESHEGETCREFDNRMDQSNKCHAQKTESITMISNITKKCPGENCGWSIEKHNGCDHMRCKCGHELYWLCSAPCSRIWRDGNTGHEKSCKYHTSKM